jgi:hypothetical protein
MKFEETILRESFDLLCDRLIGSGMSRQVFSSKLLPNCVIKVEADGGRFQNVIEWETWQRVKDTDASRWFAECKFISPNGAVLIMELTTHPAQDQYPEKMPAYLCDFKRTNYGMSHGFLVCHDYGTHLMFENGMTKRMTVANWRDE